MKNFFVGTLCLTTLVIGGQWLYRQPRIQALLPRTQPMIVQLWGDATPSRTRIPDFDKANKQLCQRLAENAQANDQSLVVAFSDRPQIISQKNVTNQMSSRQRCKTLQLAEDVRQINFSQGTHLDVPLSQSPILAEQLRQQAGDPNKPVFVVIVIDANDGEHNKEDEWKHKSELIDAMTKNGMVFVVLVSDVKLQSHLNQFIRNDRFQTCPLSDAASCLDWGIRTARAL